MNVAGMEIAGRSTSGLSTCLVLPAEKIALDIGHPVMEALRCGTVLISHAHADHLGAIAWHCSLRELLKMPKPTYIVPPEMVEDLEGLFVAWRKLDKSDFPCKIIGLAPGEQISVGKGLKAQAFRTPHRSVASQGYALIRTKSKLKPEYQGLPSEEIRRLKIVEKVSISEDVEVLELAWTSDTKAEIFEQEPWILQAERLILESTFVTDENSVEEAKTKGHTHLKEILDRKELFSKTKGILLTHFSGRYSPTQVEEALVAQLPEGLKEKVQWITEGLVD